MDYSHVDGGLQATHDAGDVVVKLHAEDIRQQRTGIHAQLTVAIDSSIIAWDLINVEKDAQRRTLAGHAFGEAKQRKLLPGDYSRATLEHELMLFARGLWAAWIGDISGEDVEGDKEPSAPPWAVPGLVLDGATAIWAGDAGANKSTLLRLVAQSLRYGVNDVIPVRNQAMVVWVNAEEPPAEHSRQVGNINQALGLDRDSDMFTLDARSLSITDLAPRIEQAVKYSAAEHVFIDSLSRMARGMNLNENATATLLIDSLAGLPTSVTWIGHTGHEYRERLAGSKHFENAARLMVLVKSRQSADGVSPELTRGVRATVYKANGAVMTEPMFWTLDYHRDYGLMKVKMADRDDWPLLHCDAANGESSCGRRTWDGVSRYGVRCSRHRGEGEEA